MNATWVLNLVDDNGNTKQLPVKFRNCKIEDILLCVSQLYLDEEFVGWHPSPTTPPNIILEVKNG